MPPLNKPEEAQAPRANIDDEVFFHHATGPKSGKVAAVGKHGCTVKHGGKHHQVKWEHVAGVKKRAQQRYTVLEKGEDGLIVQDHRGKRHYVGIPPEARPDQMVLDKPGMPRSTAGSGGG